MVLSFSIVWLPVLQKNKVFNLLKTDCDPLHSCGKLIEHFVDIRKLNISVGPMRGSLFASRHILRSGGIQKVFWSPKGSKSSLDSGGMHSLDSGGIQK